MRPETRRNARVVWVPSFVAFYNTPDWTKAGAAVGLDPKTVRDHVGRLEKWFARPLVDEEEEVPSPTIDAQAFFPLAVDILNTLLENGMYSSINRAQVRPDGAYLEDAHQNTGPAARQIGNILVKFRADLRNAVPYDQSPSISAMEIDMNWFEPQSSYND